jgi:tetratricopeptide (TPR) repeat protein
VIAARPPGVSRSRHLRGWLLAPRLRLLASLMLLAPAASTGCSRGEPPGAADRWTAGVFAAHARADASIDRGARGEARAALQAILDGAPPPAAALGERQRRALLQDTRFRLGRLALEAGEPALALAHADGGLALGGGAAAPDDDLDDLFVANLLVLRGSAREALGEGPKALADYERALRINEALLRRALPEPTP